MVLKFRKIRWYDWFVYRLFYWRWNKILQDRPDIREMMITWLKASDVIDNGELVKITVSIEENHE